MCYNVKLQKVTNYFFQISVNLKKFSKFGLCNATRTYEDGITSNRKSACYGE